MEELVKKRLDLNSDSRSDHGQGSSESGGETNEVDDQEKEKDKCIQKRR